MPNKRFFIGLIILGAAALTVSAASAAEPDFWSRLKQAVRSTVSPQKTEQKKPETVVPAPPAPIVKKPAVREPPPKMLVDDFEIGETHGIFKERKNRIDAFQGTWAKPPSYALITKVPDTRPGYSGNSLRIEFNKQGGWCGWYTLLNGIDVSGCNALTFWVKGEHGGERFDIGLSDDRMQEMEVDSIYLGAVNTYLPDGVTTEWQKVRVPLEAIRSEINLKKMGCLVFWFRYESHSAIQIDDIGFDNDPEVERIQKENTPRAEPDPRAPRALWVWKYDLVNQPQVRADWFPFFEQTAIRTIYLYMGEEPVSHWPSDQQKNLAQFLKEAHARKLEVHALQGNPLWALKTMHPKVIAWISGFLDFNAAHSPEERIDGIHMDIEPYLTQEWETGDRDRLKKEFLELLDLCRQLIDKKAVATDRPWAVGPMAKKPFVMGLAIPLFYDQEPEMEEKLLSYLDYAALMDYYDSSRDIIAEGWPHIKRAQKAGVQMVVGVETQDLVQMNQGKRRNTFFEEGWEEMERDIARTIGAFAGNPSFAGIAVHCDYSYRSLQRGRNVPTHERSGKIPRIAADLGNKKISIDGDLSEWADAKWMKVDQREQVVYGVGAWGWAQDMSYKAAVRWEPKALFLALDVTDNQVVQEKADKDLWEGDHFELWLDADLYEDYSEAVNSADDFQIGISPGNFKNLPPQVYVWVPSVSPESAALVQIAAKPKSPDAKNKSGGYTIELRIPVAFLFQNIQKRVGVDPGEVSAPRGVTLESMVLNIGCLEAGELKPGFKLGMMIDGSDTDNPSQPQKCLLSTSVERQWGDPTTFNIVELEE